MTIFVINEHMYMTKDFLIESAGPPRRCRVSCIALNYAKTKRDDLVLICCVSSVHVVYNVVSVVRQA